MDNTEELGRYIQRRLREKNVPDSEVAKALNISPKTVQKIYPLKDIYSERLSIFCKLLNENIFSDFYGQSEPLKSIINRTTLNTDDGLKDELIEIQKKHIQVLEEKVIALEASLKK